MTTRSGVISSFGPNSQPSGSLSIFSTISVSPTDGGIRYTRSYYSTLPRYSSDFVINSRLGRCVHMFGRSWDVRTFLLLAAQSQGKRLHRLHGGEDPSDRDSSRARHDGLRRDRND